MALGNRDNFITFLDAKLEGFTVEGSLLADTKIEALENNLKKNSKELVTMRTLKLKWLLLLSTTMLRKIEEMDESD